MERLVGFFDRLVHVDPQGASLEVDLGEICTWKGLHVVFKCVRQTQIRCSSYIRYHPVATQRTTLSQNMKTGTYIIVFWCLLFFICSHARTFCEYGSKTQAVLTKLVLQCNYTNETELNFKSSKAKFIYIAKTEAVLEGFKIFTAYDLDFILYYLSV